MNSIIAVYVLIIHLFSLVVNHFLHFWQIIFVVFLQRNLAWLEGFEPPADGLEIRCSILLSYSQLSYYTRKLLDCQLYKCPALEV